MKIGSLFDGSGGFPLAASMCGIKPVWASEIEPYPIAVTCSRFPNMKHLGSVTDINGAEVEPVDIITFGSPCQDLSVAGKRAGLKHEVNGDDETTRSGLFMEAVRIIREMRRATNGNYPKWAVWENVPGAFSSNKGEDFRIVLEELIKTVEPNAVMPPVPKNGWPYADCYYGDGWSLAYRVFDAQFWGVPQRRRRIYLVLDLTGERAGSVLFGREGLRGHLEESGATWQATAGDAENCTGATDRAGIAYTLKIRSGCEGGGKGALIQTEKSETLSTLIDQYLFQPVTYYARGNGDGDTVSTLTGDHENRVTDYTSLVITEEPIPIHDKATRHQGGGPTRNGDGAGNGLGVWRPGDPTPTLSTCDRHMVGYAMQGFGDYKESEVASGLKARDYKDATDLVVYDPPQYIVRRLTPTECARLQGFPDEWGHPVRKEELTEQEYTFWLNVRNTHAAINGKVVKEYTKDQMLAWYNKLHTDSAEYKMWGNGIALPCALYVMEGIAEASGTDICAIEDRRNALEFCPICGGSNGLHEFTTENGRRWGCSVCGWEDAT